MADRAPDTVTEAIALLREQGYRADYQLVDGVLVADPEFPTCAVGQAEVDKLYRFEGPSDPGDEMIVYALRDPVTDTRGTLAAAYGHSADPDLSDHLADLRRRFEPTLDA